MASTKRSSTPRKASIKPRTPTSSTNNSSSSKNRVSKPKRSAPSAASSSTQQQKTRPGTASGPQRKKRRVYTEKELGLPQLNMITPVGVQKPKGKKKGKVFVDDAVCSALFLFFYFSLTVLLSVFCFPVLPLLGSYRFSLPPRSLLLRLSPTSLHLPPHLPLRLPCLFSA